MTFQSCSSTAAARDTITTNRREILENVVLIRRSRLDNNNLGRNGKWTVPWMCEEVTLYREFKFAELQLLLHRSSAAVASASSVKSETCRKTRFHQVWSFSSMLNQFLLYKPFSFSFHDHDNSPCVGMVGAIKKMTIVNRSKCLHSNGVTAAIPIDTDLGSRFSRCTLMLSFIHRSNAKVAAAAAPPPPLTMKPFNKKSPL